MSQTTRVHLVHYGALSAEGWLVMALGQQEQDSFHHHHLPGRDRNATVIAPIATQANQLQCAIRSQTGMAAMGPDSHCGRLVARNLLYTHRLDFGGATSFEASRPSDDTDVVRASGRREIEAELNFWEGGNTLFRSPLKHPREERRSRRRP